MEEFSEYSSELVEFPSTWENEKAKRLVSSSSETEPLPPSKSQISQTNIKIHSSTQTMSASTSTTQTGKPIKVDEKKLSEWLIKIFPMVKSELEKGVTPLYNHNQLLDIEEETLIARPYQKLQPCNSASGNNHNLSEHMHGAATWLSVRTNNAPMLVICSSPGHTDWCDHVGQTITVFTPKRIQSREFIAFSELISLPVKSCIKVLSTNSYNKDKFSGGTVTGDLYIWEYVTEAGKVNNSTQTVKELFCVSTEYGSIICMEWITENDLLTCHQDRIICLWKVGKELIKDKNFRINRQNDGYKTILTTILIISRAEFIVGSEEGRLFLCSISNSNIRLSTETFENPVLLEMEKHSFAVTSLLKAKISGVDIIISCDLSGEVFFHDMRTFEEGPTLIIRMPLPFKNVICCSESAKFIFSPGLDGSLEVFKASNGRHNIHEGTLEGKGQIIKISDNRSWLVTGVYEGYFQVYKLDYK